MSRSFLWAPGPVRALFRDARFGLHCAHGVARLSVGPIVWIAQCGFDCPGFGERSAGSAFALGHHREVPVAALDLPMSNITGEYLCKLIGTPVPWAEPRHETHPADVAEVLCLAIGLGIDTWARSEGRCSGAAGRPIPNGDRALVGFVCGVPACVIAPPARDEHLVAAFGPMTAGGSA